MSLSESRFLRVIVNGKSENENENDPGLHQAVQDAKRQGHRVELRVTREPDDDLLDLRVIHDVGLPQSPLVLREMRDVDSKDSQYLFYRQVPSCHIEFTEQIRLDVNGEPMFHSTFDVDVLPRQVKVVLPPGTPLSRQ